MNTTNSDASRCAPPSHTNKRNRKKNPETAITRMVGRLMQHAHLSAMTVDEVTLMAREFLSRTTALAGVHIITGQDLEAQCSRNGHAASAVVSMRLFRFQDAYTPRLLGALLSSIRFVTGIDVRLSEEMDCAISLHKHRSREFIETELGCTEPGALTKLLVAVSQDHARSYGLVGLDEFDGLGGLVESMEDLAAAYRAGYVRSALTRMTHTGEVTEEAAESIESAILGALGASASGPERPRVHLRFSSTDCE
jgi:hypothetical protein